MADPVAEAIKNKQRGVKLSIVIEDPMSYRDKQVEQETSRDLSQRPMKSLEETEMISQKKPAIASLRRGGNSDKLKKRKPGGELTTV